VTGFPALVSVNTSSEKRGGEVILIKEYEGTWINKIKKIHYL